jgi:glutaminyl-peptide cyclotransferase
MKQSLLLVLIPVFWFNLCHAESPTWVVRKKSHKLKSIGGDGLKRTCQSADADNFKRNILKPFLRERVSDTEGNRIVQQHILTSMQRLGWNTELDSFVDSTPFGDKRFTNIVAVHNTLAPRRLTLACHFDSKLFTQFQFIGAIDSAVPCAMLIDLATRLNSVLSSTTEKDLTLELIFFDGEEAFDQWTATDSLYGSRHLADKMASTTVDAGNGETVTRIEAIEVFVLLDLIGNQATTFLNWFPATEKLYERLQKTEMKLAKEGLLDPPELFKSRKTNKFFTGSLMQGGGIEDDHIPFIRKNVPVLHLISVPFPSVWHNAGDNESALHYPTIFNIAKILRVFVAEYLNLKL